MFLSSIPLIILLSTNLFFSSESHALFSPFLLLWAIFLTLFSLHTFPLSNLLILQSSLLLLAFTITLFFFSFTPSYEASLLFIILLTALLQLTASSWAASFFLSNEIASLSIAILITFTHQNNEASIEAGLKYFWLSSLASTWILIGLFLHWNLTLWNDLSWFFLLSGIFFNLGIFPFHSWVPDIYQGSSFLWIIPLAFLPNLALLGWTSEWLPFPPYSFTLFSLSLLSILIGTLGAINQFTFGSTLGWSSIVNIGFAISLFPFSSSFLPWHYWLFYSIPTLLFLAYRWELRYNHSILSIDSLSNFNHSYILYSPFLLATLAISGIPPFIGFFPNFFILSSLSSYSFLLPLLLLFLISLPIFYYIRILQHLILLSSWNSAIASAIFPYAPISSLSAYSLSILSWFSLSFAILWIT